MGKTSEIELGILFWIAGYDAVPLVWIILTQSWRWVPVVGREL